MQRRAGLHCSVVSGYFKTKSIAVHSPGDIVALFRKIVSDDSVNPFDFSLAEDHIRKNSMGLSSVHAFQILELSNKFRPISPELVWDLGDTIFLDRFSGLSPSEFARLISILAKTDLWYPQMVPKHDSLIPHLPSACLISLCQSGLFTWKSIREEALTRFRDGRLTSLESAKLGFWVGCLKLIPESNAVYQVLGHAAWSGSVPYEAYMQLQARVESLTPIEAQMCLLALSPQHGKESERLWEIAGIWENLIFKYLCMIARNPLYVPPYPVRIPQWYDTKERRVEMVLDGHFILDVCEKRNKAVQRVRIDSDPIWRLCKRFLPPSVEIVY